MHELNINRLDLNLFVVLDAIYTEGSITRAAKTLNLTQPALSHALGRLRAVFNDPLFTRQGHRMMPSPLTRSLIGPVRQSLQTLTASVLKARQFEPAAAHRVFNISFRDVLEAKLLPELASRVLEIAPMVQIVSVRTGRADLDSELAGGSLDFAIDVLQPFSESIRRLRLFRDTHVVVARDGHPHVKDRLDLDTYLAQGHILVSSRRTGMGIEDVELSRVGLHRRIAMRCQQFFAACQVVTRTDLLLTMPEQYAYSANQNLPNKILPLPIDMSPIDIYLYWHENVDVDPANIWFRELLVSIAGGEEHP